MSDINKEIALKVTADTGQAQKAFANAQQELEETRKKLVDLALAGKQSSEEFRTLEARAGAIQDAIGDVNARVTALANDTPKLQLFGEAVRGVAAGFSIAQGAAALFGDENEDLQKAILQVQGSMALLNGVQEVANLLNKDSALRVQAHALAQNLLSVAVGKSTGAMKLFRVALVSLGIGAVVVAIGALVANWDKLTAAVTGFIDKTPFLRKVIDFISDGFERLGRALGIVPDATQKATEQMISDLEKQLELLKASGAETYAIEKRLAELRIQLAKQTGEGLADAEQELTLLVAAQNKERADKRAEEAKKQKEAALERYKQQREENKGLLENLKEFLSDAESARADARKTQAENEEAAHQERMQADAARLQKSIDQQREYDRIRLQDEQFLADQRKNLAAGSFQAIADLSAFFAGKSAESQEKAFQIQKAAAIAQTIIETYSAAQAAYRSQLTVPTPDAPIRAAVAAGIAIAAGLARVAAIRNTQFNSASTSAAPQAIRPAGIPNTPTGAPQVFNPNTSTPNLPTNPQPSAANPQPLRAYVVDRDIEQGMARRNRLREFAGI